MKIPLSENNEPFDCILRHTCPKTSKNCAENQIQVIYFKKIHYVYTEAANQN